MCFVVIPVVPLSARVNWISMDTAIGVLLGRNANLARFGGCSSMLSSQLQLRGTETDASQNQLFATLPETNIAPENQSLEDD